MGNLIGNLVGLFVIAGAAALGFISLEVSVRGYLIITYGFYALLYTQALVVGRAISTEMSATLNTEEQRAFRRYNVHIRAPGAGEIISAFLNLLRIAGLVWAGFAFFNELYVEGGLALVFFFISGGLILRNDPIRYMERQAHAGNDVARNELLNIESVLANRELYLKKMARDDQESLRT